MSRRVLRAAVALGLLAIAGGCQGSVVGSTAVSTSWVGNSFGSGTPADPDLVSKGKYVQSYVAAIAVDTDGTVYTDSPYDEGHSEAGIYKDGDKVGHLVSTHGSWYGGSAVAVDASFVYLAMHQDGFPRAGTTTYGVRRYDKSSRAPSPFSGGGDDGSVLLISTTGEVTGLATSPSELFVADADDSRVTVFDRASLARRRSFSVPGAGALAVDRAGNLWASSASGVLHLDPAGRPLGAGVDSRAVAALALDQQGRLVVGETAPDHQVLILDIMRSPPAVVDTVGERGGVFAGPIPGAQGPLRFNRITGVGADGSGRLIVAGDGDGTDLRRLSRNTTAWTLDWQLLGIEYIDAAVVDPSVPDANVIYTAHNKFVMDWRKPAGRQWTWAATTFDPTRFPQDPRTRPAMAVSPSVHVVSGHRLLALTGQGPEGVNLLAIYRFDSGSEVAVPSVVVANHTTFKDTNHPAADDWPPHQPPDWVGWIWRDADGDGRFDAGEYEIDHGPTGDVYGESWGWQIDDHGDLWQAFTDGTIQRMPLQGFDTVGNPIYSRRETTVVPYDPPQDLKGGVQRLHYDAASDTMFLAGYGDTPPQGAWGAVGDTIVRYDHWTRGQRTLRWRATVPFQWAQQISVGMAVAADRVFVAEQKSAAVRVLDANTGALLATLTPGAEVGRYSGWLDIPYPVSAARRLDGSYVVFAEEDAGAKILVYVLPHA